MKLDLGYMLPVCRQAGVLCANISIKKIPSIIKGKKKKGEVHVVQPKEVMLQGTT